MGRGFFGIEMLVEMSVVRFSVGLLVNGLSVDFSLCMIGGRALRARPGGRAVGAHSLDSHKASCYDKANQGGRL